MDTRNVQGNRKFPFQDLTLQENKLHVHTVLTIAMVGYTICLLLLILCSPISPNRGQISAYFNTKPWQVSNISHIDHYCDKVVGPNRIELDSDAGASCSCVLCKSRRFLISQRVSETSQNFWITWRKFLNSITEKQYHAIFKWVT